MNTEKTYIVHNYDDDGEVKYTTHFRLIDKSSLVLGRAVRSSRDPHHRKKANAIASGRLRQATASGGLFKTAKIRCFGSEILLAGKIPINSSHLSEYEKELVKKLISR